PPDPPPHQVVARAVGDRVERRAPVHARDQALCRPHGRRDRPARFGERRRAEQVRHDHTERQVGQLGQIERQLVDILDDDVVGVRAQQAPDGAAGVQPERVTPAAAVHAHPVEHGLAGAPRPAARHQVDAMPPLDQPAEDLVEVDFGAAGVWILAVVPVDQQDPHSAPNSRATASSTPFTNAGALAPANQWASFTASSMTTRGGVAPSASSASARRRMLFSTTPTRSSRQCSAASATRRSNSGSPAIALAARSAPRSKPSGTRPNPPARPATGVAIAARPPNTAPSRLRLPRPRAARTPPGPSPRPRARPPPPSPAGTGARPRATGS